MINRRIFMSIFLLCSGVAYAQNGCGTIPGDNGIRQLLTDIVVPELNTLESKLDPCCTAIANDFIGTWTLLEAIASKVDIPCPSCMATAISAPGTISMPGSYCLAKNITGTITIAADDVTLDLNNHTIDSGSIGVEIMGNNATVLNGTIQNTSACGIKISGANNSVLTAIDVINTPTGYILQNTSSSLITECRARIISSAGFSLVASSTNNLVNCQTITMTSTGTAYGFYAADGTLNNFTGCAATDISTSSTLTGDRVAGFYLTDSESNDTINACRVTNVQSPDMNVTACGIFVANSGHTITANNVIGVTAGGNAGVGIFAESTVNYVAQNTACSNDKNYSRVDALFLGSQANARGVANVDCSLPNTPNSIEADFSGTYTTIAAIITETWSIESKCEVVSDKLVSIPSQFPIEQNATTIENSFTLSQPGSYFLRQNMGTNGGFPIAIRITSSDVTLDLNGFTFIGALIINEDLENITIKNGILSGAPDPLITLNNNDTNVSLSNLLFHFCLTSMWATTASTIANLIIKNCSFIGYNNYGVDLNEAALINGLCIQDCYFNANSSADNSPTDIAISNGNHIQIINAQHMLETPNATGCLLTTCTNSVVQHCSYQINKNVYALTTPTNITCFAASSCTQLNLQRCITQNATDITGSSTGLSITACTDAVLSECKAIGNGNAQSEGFIFMSTGTAVTAERCVAINNDHGFYVDGITNMTLERCLAEKNSIGFDFSATSTNGLVQECVAQGNTSIGFSDSAGASSGITYTANIARDNGTDYSTTGAPFNPVLFSDGPTYWQNVQ